jgi:hypothetical protein
MATAFESTGPRTLGKVRPHQTQNEALVFEKSSPGKRAYMMPPLDVPAVDSAALLRATGSSACTGDCDRDIGGMRLSKN